MPIACLVPQIVDRFKQAIGSGKIDPDELMNMSSAERRNLLTDIVGADSVHDVNSLIESKLLLKNQKQGIVNAIKKLSGLGERDMTNIIKLHEDRFNTYMDPNKLDTYLGDLAQDKVNRQFKLIPSEEETAGIITATKDIETAKSAIPDNAPIRSSERLDYGMKQALLNDHIAQLKKQPFKAKDLLSPIKVAEAIGGSMKSAVASMDNSFFGRQGIKTLYTNPDIWIKNFGKSWVDIGKQVFAKGNVLGPGDDAAMLAIKSDILSRPNAINGKYAAGDFAVGVKAEEAFPSSMPEHIPLLGRLFKASEVAYNGAALRMRADLADRVIAAAERNGVNMLDKTEARGVGNLVNAMTGRGSIGLTEGQSKFTNAAIFSIRFVKSNFDTLTMHLLDKDANAFVKKTAALNIAKIVGSMAAVLATNEMLNPGTTEYDPRGSMFGKVRVNGVPIDISGGMLSLVTLAARLAPSYHDGEFGWWSKNSTTGVITKTNTSEYGKSNVMDIFNNFWEGKLSPMAGIIRDVWQDGDFQGNAPTIYNEAKNTGTPLSIQQTIQLKNASSANILALMIMDGLGFSINPPNTNNSNIQNILGDKPSGILGMIGAPSKQSADFQPLIQKMLKEKAKLSVPASSTTIQPMGARESRPMTPKELSTYRDIYNKNLKEDLMRSQNFILNLTGDQFNKALDGIKTDTTKKSKYELLKGMVK